MDRPGTRRVFLLLLTAALCLHVSGDFGLNAARTSIPFASAMPDIVLWAWEEPEDMTRLDTQRVGVAYLAETLLLGGPTNDVRAVTRHQPLVLPPNAAVMAVVRIETLPGFHDAGEMRNRTAALLADVSYQHPLRALQIDFDATRSERAFYAGVLAQLRPQMPQAFPLSITALASWCGADPAFGLERDWLATLPIDEAVPMLFRLGGHTRPNDSKDQFAMREPLCRAGLGLSTDESWPSADNAAPRRIYLFSPRPWQPAQIAAAAMLPAMTRPAVLRVGANPQRAGINDTGLHPETNSPPEAQP